MIPLITYQHLNNLNKKGFEKIENSTKKNTIFFLAKKTVLSKYLFEYEQGI